MKGSGVKGRPFGSKNSRTEQWEIFTNYCLEGGLQRFKEELNSLEGKRFVDAFLNVLEFHKPKMSRAIITGEGGKDLFPSKIEIVFKSVNGKDDNDSGAISGPIQSSEV